MALVSRSEIDAQVATAKKYPRAVARFIKQSIAMVTLDEATAQSCIYALPRDGKTIEGPSVRLAEIIASMWGNFRAGSRIISEDAEFVTAQGVVMDLETNVAISCEVKRRITDRNGRRYKPDMIVVTSNAACSIALRNAITKGIPKAFWQPIYDAARKTAAGDQKTIATRFALAVSSFQVYGVTQQQICKKLGIESIENVTADHLVILRGIYNGIKENEFTPESAFADEVSEGAKAATTQAAQDLKEKLDAKRGKKDSNEQTRQQPA